MRARELRLATVVSALGLGLVATGAEAGTIPLPAVFASQVRALDRKTDVPILLPSRLPWSGRVPRLYPAAYTAGRGWVLSLAGAPRCGGASACFVASFAGRPGARLAKASNLRLPGGQAARYEPIRCGASCGPATLQFVYRGTVQTWKLEDPPSGGAAALGRLAASAIASGPRTG